MSSVLFFFHSNWLNLTALIWFLFCFNGYMYYAKKHSYDQPCLASLLHNYRHQWMLRMLTREMRIADNAAIANLEKSVAFFASTTMLILAGLMTILGSTAKAIGTSTVCAIEYESLTSLSLKLPTLQKQLMNLMSKEFSSAQALLAEQSADRKLAGFLLGLSTRFKQRGYSETTFNLAMQRSDIANNLNMAPETVSRMFKRLKGEGIIDLNVNEVTILDMPQLLALSGCLSVC